MYRIACVLIGYIFGNIQASYILGKAVKKIDIREHGTGNAGTANSLLVMGGKFAVIVLAIDIKKSFAAYAVCSYIFSGSGMFFSFGGGMMGVIPGIYGSFGAILGHLFPAHMGMRGGKGIASGIGMVLALSLPMTVIILAVAALAIVITRYLTSASIIAAASLPILLAFQGYEAEAVVIGTLVALLLVFKHKDNIINLINGKEAKVWQKG